MVFPRTISSLNLEHLTFEVNISHVESPSNFWCILCKDENVYNCLTERIQVYCKDAPPCTRRWKMGDYCCAQSKFDSYWYRALINSEPKDGICSVFFVDTGKTENLSFNRLKQLKPEFFEIPCLAVCCQLQYLVPFSSEYWSENAKTVFRNAIKRDLLCKFAVKLHSDKFDVILFGKNDGVNIATILVQGGHAKLIMNPEIAARLTIEPSISNAFFHHDLTGATSKVVISVYTNPYNFYVQEKSRLIALKTLKKQLTIDATKTRYIALENAVPGTPCTAPFNDGHYYRAVVMENNENTCTVFYVDFGSSAVVDKSQCIPILNHQKVDSVYAHKCCLANIEVINPEENSERLQNEFFKLNERNATCVFHSVNAGVYSVSLYVNKCKNFAEYLSELKLVKYFGDKRKSDFENVMKSMGYALPDCDIKPPLTSASNLSMKQFITPQLTINPGKQEKFYITYINDVNEFYVWLAKVYSQNEEFLSSLNKFYKSYNFTPIDPAELVEGGAVVIKQKDGNFHRAKIRDIMVNFVEVKLVDHGSRCKVPIKNIFYCDDQFMGLPVQAIACSLDGFDNEVPVHITQKMEHLCLNRVLSARIIGTKMHHVISVILYLKDDRFDASTCVNVILEHAMQKFSDSSSSMAANPLHFRSSLSSTSSKKSSSSYARISDDLCNENIKNGPAATALKKNRRDLGDNYGHNNRRSFFSHKNDNNCEDTTKIQKKTYRLESYEYEGIPSLQLERGAHRIRHRYDDENFDRYQDYKGLTVPLPRGRGNRRGSDLRSHDDREPRKNIRSFDFHISNEEISYKRGELDNDNGKNFEKRSHHNRNSEYGSNNYRGNYSRREHVSTNVRGSVSSRRGRGGYRGAFDGNRMGSQQQSRRDANDDEDRSKMSNARRSEYESGGIRWPERSAAGGAGGKRGGRANASKTDGRRDDGGFSGKRAPFASDGRRRRRRLRYSKSEDDRSKSTGEDISVMNDGERDDLKGRSATSTEGDDDEENKRKYSEDEQIETVSGAAAAGASGRGGGTAFTARSRAYKLFKVETNEKEIEFSVNKFIDCAHLEIMIQSREDDLCNLMEKINKNVENFSQLTEILIDSPCVALFDVDNEWYRGIITKQMDSSSVMVKFIDFGNTAIVPIEHVRILPECFAVDPPFSICCYVYGVADTPVDQNTFLNAEQLLICNNDDDEDEDDENHTWSGELEEIDGGNFVLRSRDLIDFMCRNKLCISYELCAAPPCILPEPFEECRLAMTYDPSNFYVTLLRQEDDIRELETEISSAAVNSCALPFPITVGAFCLAKDSDGEWRRSIIYETSHSNNPEDHPITVFCCDVGFFEENVHLSDLRPLSKNLWTYPRFAYRCMLSSGGEFTDEETEKLSEKGEHPMKVKFFSFHAPFLVEIDEFDLTPRTGCFTITYPILWPGDVVSVMAHEGCYFLKCFCPKQANFDFITDYDPCADDENDDETVSDDESLVLVKINGWKRAKRLSDNSFLLLDYGINVNDVICRKMPIKALKMPVSTYIVSNVHVDGSLTTTTTAHVYSVFVRSFINMEVFLKPCNLLPTSFTHDVTVTALSEPNLVFYRNAPMQAYYCNYVQSLIDIEKYAKINDLNSIEYAIINIENLGGVRARLIEKSNDSATVELMDYGGDSRKVHLSSLLRMPYYLSMPLNTYTKSEMNGKVLSSDCNFTSILKILRQCNVRLIDGEFSIDGNPLELYIQFLCQLFRHEIYSHILMDGDNERNEKLIHLNCFVSRYVSNDEFYIQPFSNDLLLKKLSDLISIDFGKMNENDELLSIGDGGIFGAYDLVNEFFYRCRIIKYIEETENYVLFLIDTGDTRSFGSDFLFKISTCLQHIPPLAINCTLFHQSKDIQLMEGKWYNVLFEYDSLNKSIIVKDISCFDPPVTSSVSAGDYSWSESVEIDLLRFIVDILLSIENVLQNVDNESRLPIKCLPQMSYVGTNFPLLYSNCKTGLFLSLF